VSVSLLGDGSKQMLLQSSLGDAIALSRGSAGCFAEHIFDRIGLVAGIYRKSARCA